MNKSIILLLAATTLLLTGCNPYRKISYSKVDFYKKHKVVEKMDDYDLYIQQGDEVYEFEVTEREGDILKGRTKRVKATEKKEALKENTSEDVTVTKEMRDDMVLQVEDGFDLDSDFQEGELTTLSPEDVQEVAVYAKEDQGAIGAAGTVLLVILGVILALILILVLVISSAVSEAADGTGGSGSDSNSGGSNSGGSGCFIATMAYGSYDAKEVLVLRRFRDKFLQKFGLGRAFIRWYYANSPAFVSQHQGKMWLHKSLRIFLNGMVFILSPFFPSK